MSTRAPWALLLAMMLSCSGTGDTPRVVIHSAPVERLAEGIDSYFDVAIEPTPRSGISADSFELLGMDAGLFAVADFDNLEDGRVRLHLRPKCDAVPRGEPEAATLLEVAATDQQATSAEVGVQISDLPGAECLPAVSAWLGDCATPGDDLGDLVVAPKESVQTLCVRAWARDPMERLWIRFGFAGPSELIEAAALIGADDISDTTIEIPIRDTRYIRGRFDLDIYVYRTEPTAEIDPDRSSSRALVIGQPGDFAIERWGANPAATEFDGTPYPLRLWYFAPPGDSQVPCVRANRTTPTVNASVSRGGKPFLRLHNALGESVIEDEWSCGSAQTLGVSPGIDSPRLELVELQGALCDDPTCSAPLLTTARELAIELTSPAEELACELNNPGSPLMVICADVIGDADPEVFIKAESRDGCAGWGEEGRLSNIQSVDGLNFSQPESSLTLQLEGPLGLETMVLGQDDNAIPPILRELILVDGKLAWSASMPPELPFNPLSKYKFERAVTYHFPPSPATTHVLWPITNMGFWYINQICFREEDTCDGTMTPLLFGNQIANVEVAIADLDGDGIKDVVAFGRHTDGIDFDVEARRVLDFGSLLTDSVHSIASISPTGDDLAPDRAISAAAVSNGAGAEDLYFVVRAGENAELHRIVGVADDGGETFFTCTDCRVVERIISIPSPPRAVVSVGDRLFLGSAQGLHERLSDTVWRISDPVLREQIGGSGEVAFPPPGYAQFLVACTAATEQLAFSSSYATARRTELDVEVAEP